MIELKLRSILKQVKNENPQKRYEALDQLFEYKRQEGLEVQIDVIKDIIKTAASRFPDRVDNWDNPSYYLIDFVCDFPMPEVIEGLLKHFDGFDLQAKERAIEFLLGTEDEEIFYFLEEKIVDLIQTENFLIPISELAAYPMLIKGILDKTLDKLGDRYYKFMLYDLVLSLNSSGFEKGYKKETILPALLKDYRVEKEEYLKFDADFSSKFVYTAWKKSYFTVRARMRLFISLMEYYFSEDVRIELEQAMNFSDPFIKTEALLVCIGKNIPYHPAALSAAAQQIETAEMVYWELKEKNLEHLYPIKEGKQPHLAKTRFFSTIINLPEEEEGVIRYPEDIQVMDKLETENMYGQQVRYYLMSFVENGVRYAGWAGGYALEDGDDTAELWDGSYTEFVEWDAVSVEEHKAAFFKKRDAEWQEHETSVYYESSPRLSRGAWFFLGLAVVHWVKAVFTGFREDSIPVLAVLTVVGAGLCLYELTKNKQRKVQVVGQQLVKVDGSKQTAVEIAEIKKVEYNKKNVLVYNKKNEVTLSFPIRWVNYGLFYAHMKEHTDHLKERPFIQS
ncbi:hypothetical protein QE429_000465 [Bacillus sp. SORGH_AS 510]|uniref:hypothetical protein n=1 Tax=Bacillus sp. SORGH_AS_0510 TaxID=3041771 RepID=UPI002788B67A|nr:hypothetical protein [Bacillus sp. SORGH_AS_0510]MDQ1143638.1 hypothetical protein [Bacillus sp. SORGH_AS_0510]